MGKKGFRLGRLVPLVTVLALVLALLFAFAAPVSAATITVCAVGCDHTTIQAAVNAANANDVIHAYPGTYNESVDLSGMTPDGNITLMTVNSAGTPTPGTATVNGGATGPGIYTVVPPSFSGNVTIDGFIVDSTVAHGAYLAVNGDVVIRNVIASGTAGHGIYVTQGDEVTITHCTASNNHLTGILVVGVSGRVTISNCTANDNDGSGIGASAVTGDLTINRCIARDNEEDGVDLEDLQLGNTFVANRSILCSNGGAEVDLDTPNNVTVDAEGNWYGCTAGPEGVDPACGGVLVVDQGSVDYSPWISLITASATPDPGTVGQPTEVRFQFSDSARTIFLGKGPGDLHGAPTFTIHTDNGTLTDTDETGATVHEFIGSGNVLSVTLIPHAAGTATVTLDGPCELDAGIIVGVEAEFVPEAGSILLLGSGLAGLAGYATLRLRSGQALRWRTRE